MARWPFLLVAALVSAVALGAGPHRLQYELTETQDASLPSRFVAKKYLYHRLILCDDNKNGRPKPQGLLAQLVLGAIVTSGFAEDRKDLQMKLADIRGKLRQKGGSHSLQEIQDCEIQEETTTTRLFWRFIYDGEPFLFYNETTHEWEAPQSSFQPLAMEVKNSWGTRNIINNIAWANVRNDVCQKLRRYQEEWMNITKRNAMNGICSQASDGVASGLCWAPGFSLWNISLVWPQDDAPMSLNAQLTGAVLSYENGTYCARVAPKVPQGEEQRFTYSMEHSGNHFMTYGKEPVHQRPWPAVSWGIAAAAAVTVLVAAVLLYNFGLRKTSAGEHAGPDIVQDSSQHQVAPTALHWTRAQGCQPLLSAPESRNSTGDA
ncbi:MHC class I polypeptide-related sequence B-like [Talpa occidentalis]|uniref:MHC class I polypeptide-related sequence B-like n=1 Tax=Talpa occidentalis TaxID=50954 RepID=UPI00188EE51C|nr:MHC class I polypeptide-related sequence B-like [Talpa occidentalis]